jgi:hypothetical protein
MKRYILVFLVLICSAWIYFYFDYRKPAASISEEIKPKKESDSSKELDQILFLDQKYRREADSTKAIPGEEFYRVDSVYKLARQADSMNLIRVARILDSIGFPDHDEMGPNGHDALFLVIQHADLNTQEKYLPMIREAAKKDLLPQSCLALLEDRVLLREGKKQIYGSQIGYDEKKKVYYILPLEDPDSVDSRRFKVHLQPISAYAMRFQIIWNAEKYKKDLPYYEKLGKNGSK